MQSSDLSVVEVTTPEELADVARLFCNYADWLNVDLRFQSFAAEVAQLPGSYAPPRGRLLLAKSHGAAAGCVGLRPLGTQVCEMKRLWVEPEFQGRGFGRRLAESIVAAGQALGYRAMRLDTMPERLPAAQRIYRALGFQAIPPYYANPLPGVAMFELVYEEAEAR